MKYELLRLYAYALNWLRRWQWVTLPGMRSLAPFGAPQANSVTALLGEVLPTMFETAPRVSAHLAYAATLLALL
ncbi:hypothetical protein KC887_06685 [Candidatus Kaiserbacteria bacterium]|nr:hypothetical protein [Candidatus Kaiserbacteria bacterium]